jgi:RNA polymerase sigma factor (sigma-70 family)
MTLLNKNISDEELMVLYQANDYAAFEVLYKRHSERIFSYLNKKVSSSIAEDLMQDVFIRLHKNKHRYNSKFLFLPWIFTVTRNALFDHFKKIETRVAQTSEPIDENTQTLEIVVPKENDTQSVLDHLPEDLRRIFELRYLKDWSFEDIAKETSTSPENIRQKISRGVKKLRALLSAEENS